MSDIHRKDDFLWSAVGLFYALVLWFCARNITGAVLLGQASAAVLLVSFVWQTLKLRKAISQLAEGIDNPEQAIAINNFSVLQAVNGLLKGKKNKPQVAATSSVKESPDVVTESEIAIPQTTSDKVKTSSSNTNTAQNKAKKPGTLGKIFGKKKQAAITNTSLDEILDEEEVAKEEVAKQEVPTKTENTQPPVSIESKKQPQPETITQIAQDQLEIEDNTPQEIEDNVEKDSVKEEAKADLPETLKPEESSPKEEIKAFDNQEVENQTADTAEVDIPVETKPETSTKVEETADSLENTVQKDSAQKNKITPVEVEPQAKAKVSPIETTETVEEIPGIEPEKKVSPLDSLETVEVAEVLEALPENSSGERDNNQSNIIEVNTTDIEEVIESKETDQDLPSDTKSD